MKSMWKRMATGAMMVCALGLVAGCGSSEKVGEVTDRLAQVQGTQTEEQFQQTQLNAQQELQIYGQAKGKEFKAYVESNIQAVAKEKELTVVANDQAIVSGGVDITEDVLKKMNESASSGETSK